MSKVKTPEELAVDFYETKGWYVEDEPYEFAKFYHEYMLNTYKNRSLDPLSKSAIRSKKKKT
jgi:hypothetical protein